MSSSAPPATTTHTQASCVDGRGDPSTMIQGQDRPLVSSLEGLSLGHSLARRPRVPADDLPGSYQPAPIVATDSTTHCPPSWQNRGSLFGVRPQGQGFVESTTMRHATPLEIQESDVDMSYSSDSADDLEPESDTSGSPVKTLAPYIGDLAITSLTQYHSRRQTEGQRGIDGHIAAPGDAFQATAAGDYDTDRIHPSTVAKRETLGCPFYLANSVTYRDCLQFGPLNIHAVKKHVVAHHQRPPYCYICGRTFSTYPALNRHMDDRSCSRTENPPVVDGVDQAQIERLGRRSDGSVPPMEQHGAIWSIVFPGVELPTTGLWLDPNDRHVQAVQDLTEYWSRNGTRLVHEFLESKTPTVQLKGSGLKSFQAGVLAHMLQLMLSNRAGAGGMARKENDN